MNTEDKYYTPSIEEFFVGFEYEYRNTSWGYLENTKGRWITEGFIAGNLQDGESEVDEIEALIKEGDVRIKYLDKADIESLDWIHDFNLEPIPNRKIDPVFEGFSLEKGDKQYMLYYFNDHELWIELVVNCSGEGYIFKGTVKNKSELIKILKQVGIK